jgi:hypothetical protein
MSSLFGSGKKTNNRKFPGVKGKRPDLAKFRKDDAKERQEAYSALSVEEKVARLDRKLGVGLGAKKQREKLAR